MALKLLLSLIVATSLLPQDKPASTPITNLIECVTAKSCKNGVESTVNWADFAAPVVLFKNAESSFSVRSNSKGGLSIWITPAGSSRPSRLIAVDNNGLLLSAELGPQPGEKFPMRMTPEQTAEKRKLRQAYHVGQESPKIETFGGEHKAMWQKQADEALAAIARIMAR